MISNNQLDEVVESILREHRRGQVRDVDHYVEKHPELEEQIREVVPAVLMMEKFKAATEFGHNSVGGSGVLLGGKSIQQLGDYEIVRELGRGGMGVVYEATQQSLNRSVAVKVLKHSYLANETSSLRFIREARIAAQLHHTNIVPILDVAQHDDVHFYVMQLIDGCSFDRVMNVLHSLSAEDLPAGIDSSCVLRPSLREASIATRLLRCDAFTDEQTNEDEQEQTRPLSDHEISELQTQRFGRDAQWWRHVAEVGKQVADALAYAHGQGVLHRDIKPGNLILDNQQRVWVTDFGLATSDESMSITASGDAVGTLRYMAPEQFDAKTDTCSDIYSLGATLYELATGHPAFTGNTKPQLIQRILSGACKRPRQHVPSMPRDLENIILKAMAHAPQLRYQSAQELHSDLSRFLQNRPVQARPINIVTRCWRWCRRQPAVAIPTLSAGLLLLLVAVIATSGYFRVKQALTEKAAEYQRAEQQQALAGENLKKANESLTIANRERSRAEHNLSLSLESLEKVFDRFTPWQTYVSESPGEHGSEEFETKFESLVATQDVELLQDLLRFYDRFTEQNQHNNGLTRAAAHANRRVGDIYQHLGQFDESSRAYADALKLYKQLLVESPIEDPMWTTYASIKNQQGLAHKMNGQREQARSCHLAALATLRKQLAIDPQSTSTNLELVRTHNLLGIAIWGYQQNRDKSPRLLTSAEKNHRTALSVLNKLIKSDRKNPEYQLMLARSYRDLSSVLFARRDHTDGVAASSQAIQILLDLVKQHPQVPAYKYELMRILSKWDSRPWGQRGLREGEARYRLALKLAKELAADHPTVPEYGARIAYTQHKLAVLLSKRGKYDAAVAEHKQAIAKQRQQVSEHPEVALYRLYFLIQCDAYSQLLFARKSYDEAKSTLIESIADSKHLPREFSDSGNQRVARSHITNQLTRLRQLEQLEISDSDTVPVVRGLQAH